ncbi:glycosyl transferase family protein [Paenibacillus dendritiformis C454]|uniref:Glycosyl transferase family protein n=1 Tax=Paenibacillus dendritiformis C454 TaxID=1131935 RepID=H3S9M3_9BACL|nr:glycosyltransferase family 2 protein [Paenibacillus dendritiformis]EHQ64141.1 glycosyl transferase family protein [Paenibacillus dendritiformis C454]
MNIPTLYITVPCYNEEDALPETTKHLLSVLSSLINEKIVAQQSRLLFIDDGSKDNTWMIIKKFNSENPLVLGLKLSKNVGHQKALFSGLIHAKEYADCVISMDADLQDDIWSVKEFVFKFLEGFEVVYGVRRSRNTDTWFKRWSAEAYYKCMNKLGIPLIYNHADYRLLSKRVLNNLSNFKEANLFLRGVIPLIGFRSTVVEYDRKERIAGESKYPLKKMLSLAWDGITSFSVKPIRLVTVLGFISLAICLVAALYAFVSKLLNYTVSGWTSLMLSIWFIGSIQLLALGVIGEYIGKIYAEVKGRPLFISEELLIDEQANSKN